MCSCACGPNRTYSCINSNPLGHSFLIPSLCYMSNIVICSQKSLHNKELLLGPSNILDITLHKHKHIVTTPFGASATICYRYVNKAMFGVWGSKVRSLCRLSGHPLYGLVQKKDCTHTQSLLSLFRSHTASALGAHLLASQTGKV